MLFSQPNIAKFEQFMNLVQDSASKARDSAETLGEIPDDYLGTAQLIIILSSSPPYSLCFRSHHGNVDDRSSHITDFGKDDG